MTPYSKPGLALGVTVCAALFAGAAGAAGEMRPGLWQMSVTLSPDQMASMPKDVKVPGLTGNVMSFQNCISATEADNLGLTDDDGDKTCKITQRSLVGKTHKVEMACGSPDRKGTTRAEVTFTDPGAFTSMVEFKGDSMGKAVSDSHASSGKWLNANCGAVR